MAKKEIVRDVTYLLVMKDDSLKKVTVPSDYNVTFGALYPGKDCNNGKTGLRFYKGKHQLAVFTDVESFRDMSIPIEERVTTKREETFYKGDGENKKAVVVEGTIHEWVNPDEPKPQQGQPLLSSPKVVTLD